VRTAKLELNPFLSYWLRVFLRHRSTQAESFDLVDRPEAETIAAFKELDRINHSFRFSQPFKDRLPNWLGPDRCAHLEILDLGAGTGLLGRELSSWAKQRGWEWHFTNLDSNALALKQGNPTQAVLGSALNLPFPDQSFDLVIASQMTHHLTDEEVITHWREANRVSRDAIFICDLHRNIGFYALLWSSMLWLKVHPTIREDAMISVRRGFRKNEWLNLARKAGLQNPHVAVDYGARIVLQVRKG
jgi:SAM-dependent methyltransferase